MAEGNNESDIAQGYKHKILVKRLGAEESDGNREFDNFENCKYRHDGQRVFLLQLNRQQVNQKEKCD